MVPRTVLTRFGLISLNTARPVNTVQPRTTVNNATPMKNVNTARPKEVLSAVKGNKGNDVKASACWVWRQKHKVLDHGNPHKDLKDKGEIDSGCSRHMTGNKSYLIDYEEIDGGFIAFGERELVRIKIDDGNAFWNEIGVNAGDLKLMLLGIYLLLPVLVNVVRHKLTTAGYVNDVRHNLLLLGYCWATAKVKTVNGEVQIQSLVDKKKVIITKTSVRSDLQLEDAEGTECLPNATIFEQLTLMGAKTTAWNKFSSTMASAVICLATN
ncbi:hypothetical protein Tco_0810889 [Tanacetum coccineum]